MATFTQVRELVLSSVKLPSQLVQDDHIQKAIDQALTKLNQRTGGKVVRSFTPLPDMIPLRDPAYDLGQVIFSPMGEGLYAGLIPWSLDNVDTHAGAWRYFLDLVVEYTHLAVAGPLAIADGFNEMPFSLEFRNIYEQAQQRIQEIDRDIQENWLISQI